MKIYDGEVYYSPQATRFFQVRSVHDDYMLCGGFTEFYESATSVHYVQPLLWGFVAAGSKVVAVDEHPHAELTRYGWKIKGLSGA